MDTAHTSKAIWIPRVLAGMLIVLFLTMSLDAFDGSGSVSQQILVFAIQSIPAVVMAVLLALSWKMPRLSGALFLGLAIVFTVFFNTYRSAFSFILISLVPAVIGICFLLLSSKRD